MADNRPHFFHFFDEGFSPLKKLFWRMTAILVAVLLFWFGLRVFDLSDPVVFGIYCVAVGLVLFFTRRFVKKTVSEEYIRSLMGGGK